MEPSTDEPAEPVGDGPSAKGTEGGAVYQSRRSLLTPADVRWQDFPLTRFGRRGFDPEAVRRFLRRVEADLDVLYREIVAARDEARHHRDAAAELRAQRWRPDPSAQRPRAEYRRPPMWPPYSPRRQGCHRRPGDGPGDD
ncbi:DivIVA domain-containing protein [Micromonospora okii]|uniref:DivIVA domain-containing protein n=1 Tax=Micromonospora okii TaxID=1182970 RepID=UPI001E4C3080|nr:DivIVA domain-containing protein [Micromonospora okii]